ncbi:MAG: hypothetical protein EOS28_30130 [Mesorhizobium sp.]|nr:MAG: hypothetical protein EOS28_30130 [Mesorhizobium sp.]
MPPIGPSSYGSESGIEGLDAYLRTNFVAEIEALAAPGGLSRTIATTKCCTPFRHSAMPPLAP